MWASETTLDIENIMTIDGFQYGSISLEDLKNMVSLMEEHSINECNFNHEIEDGCLEKVSLVVEKKTERKITQREWMVKYSEYVNLKIKENENLWKRCVKIGKVRDSQYRLYLELKERFEQ